MTHLASPEEDEDVREEVVAECAEARQRRHRRRPHRRVLQDDPVVDVADVAGRVGGLRMEGVQSNSLNGG